MTAHPIDTEALRREALGQLGLIAADPRWPGRVLALLGLLAAAEHRATRAEAQAAIRGRAVVMYRDRAREAEARIKAVRELHCSDGHDGTCGEPDCFETCAGCFEDYPCPTIRALSVERADKLES